MNRFEQALRIAQAHTPAPREPAPTSINVARCRQMLAERWPGFYHGVCLSDVRRDTGIPAATLAALLNCEAATLVLTNAQVEQRLFSALGPRIFNHRGKQW